MQKYALASLENPWFAEKLQTFKKILNSEALFLSLDKDEKVLRILLASDR